MLEAISDGLIVLAQSLVRDVPDFPKPGIVFKDISPVLADPAAMHQVVDLFCNFASPIKPSKIVGIESRGFIFGMPLAYRLGIGFVPVRKAGKLPGRTIKEEYTLEYATNAMEIQEGAIRPGECVLIVDDLLATGGTASAAAKLVRRLGGHVGGFAFLIELGFLHGRTTLSGEEVLALINYD